MKLTVEELFAHSLVISCDRRRLDIMRHGFEREGLPMPRTVEGFQFRHIADNQWWHAPGGRYVAVNCYATHVMCVKMAQFLGWPFVAIFEDDAWPRAGAREALERELSNIPDGCGAFFLGWCKRRNGDVFCGSHACVFFADCYETFIDAHKTELKSYSVDLSFRYYLPLRRRIAFASQVLFCQMNFRNGKWIYTGATRGWSRDPDPGFPRAGDVLPPEMAFPPEPPPVDVLYVVGRGAKDIDDRPLRWSLRSLAKHARGIGRVIVAGYPPEWLSPEAVAVPVPDEPGMGKQASIALCAIKAARAAGIGGAFLYSSDDHYLLADADLRWWPRYYTGEMETSAVSGHARSLVETRRFLASRGLPSWRRACVHLDTWMDGADLDRAEALVRDGAAVSRLGLEPTCVFNALYEARGGAGHELYMHDRKANAARDCDVKVGRRRPGFSTTPEAERDPGVVAWMEAQFGEKSKWER